jgi:hypothetical protein
MWILERTHQFACGLRGHDTMLHFEPKRLSLRCLNCSLQTRGWSLEPEATPHHFSSSFLNARRLYVFATSLASHQPRRA